MVVQPCDLFDVLFHLRHKHRCEPRDGRVGRVHRFAQPLRTPRQQIGDQRHDIVNTIGSECQQQGALAANVIIKKRCARSVAIHGVQRWLNRRQRSACRDLLQRRSCGETCAKRVERIDQHCVRPIHQFPASRGVTLQNGLRQRATNLLHRS